MAVRSKLREAGSSGYDVHGGDGEVSRIRRDFLAAIERLVANSPHNPELVKARKNGNLKINFSSVALEAGHSRTNIGMEKCRLPDVRQRVLDLMAGRESSGSAVAVIIKLRSELRTLKAEIELLRTGHVEMMFERDEAMKDAKRWRDAYQRCRDSLDNERKVVQIVPN